MDRDLIDPADPVALLTLRHEAAHTIIALHFGFEWRETRVHRSNGHIVGCAHLVGGDRSSLERAHAWALVAAAGPVIDTQTKELRTLQSEEVRSDLAKVREYVHAIGGGESDVSRVLDVAAALIACHQHEIETMTAELVEARGIVGPLEAKRVLDRLETDCPHCLGITSRRAGA